MQGGNKRRRMIRWMVMERTMLITAPPCGALARVGQSVARGQSRAAARAAAFLFLNFAPSIILTTQQWPSSMSNSYHSQPIAGPSSSSLAANPSASAPAVAAPRRSRRHRPRCPQCGSKHFKRHASTGTLVCREGHVLQGYREEETHDDLDFHAVGYKRQVKKKRRKKEKERVE